MYFKLHEMLRLNNYVWYTSIRGLPWNSFRTQNEFTKMLQNLAQDQQIVLCLADAPVSYIPPHSLARPLM